MSDPSERTFTADFRRFFLRGLVVLLPSVLTLWIVVKAYQFVDTTIAEPINRGVRLTIVNTARVWRPLRSTFDPGPDAVSAEVKTLEEAGKAVPGPSELVARMRADNIHQWWADHWYMDLIGIFVAIIAVYVAGRLLGGFVGRRLYRKIEDVITTLPVFKQVYPYVKQIVDFLFSDEQPMKFNRVVAVEYPRRGIWSVGFLTGAAIRSIGKSTDAEVTVFIPSSPTPFTGYTITVPRADVIELPMTVEEAIRFAVSGGVLRPEDERPETGVGALPSGLIPLPGGADANRETSSGSVPRDDEPPQRRTATGTVPPATTPPAGRPHQA